MYKIRYGEQTLLLKVLQIFLSKKSFYTNLQESGNGHYQKIIPTSCFITLILVCFYMKVLFSNSSLRE